jgi:hypothetical protein
VGRSVGLGALAERPAPLPGLAGRPSPRRAASTIGRASGFAAGAAATAGAGVAGAGGGAAGAGACVTTTGVGAGFGGPGRLAVGAAVGAAEASSAAKNRCQEASTD